MKRILFVLGIGLLALAFLVTGAELAARAIAKANGEVSTLLLSLAEVWRLVAPGSHTALLSSPNWPKVQYAFQLPGWLLFGVPGLALVITCHKRADGDEAPDQFQDREDSLFLFDALAAAAEKEGYSGLQDDMAPSNFTDMVPAEAHFAENPIEPELRPERDFLLDPTTSKPTEPEAN